MSATGTPSVGTQVTVVIPTLGRPILSRALGALATGTCCPAAVIVVDQGRSAEIERMVEEARTGGLPVEYLPSEGKGRAVGVNEGIRHARTPFVLVTDDDCMAEPEWVETMARALGDHPGAVVTGRIEAWEEGRVPVTVTTRTPFVQRRPRLTFDSLSGGNMGVSRRVIGALGGLDEDPLSATAEDAELAYRALRAGVPLVYEPASGVAHADWREGPARVAQIRSYARSQGAFYGKYLRRGDFFIAARSCLHLLRAAMRCVRGILRRDAELAMNGWTYLTRMPGGICAGFFGPRGAVRPLRRER
jgi:GT2 family glycosyltransferase